MRRKAVFLFRLVATLATVLAACWLSGVALEPRSLLLVAAFLGLALAVWAMQVNRAGGRIGPAPRPVVPIRTGPYRFVRHPMYVGQSIAMAFFMWYAAGFWAALSMGILVEIVFSEYAWRERGSPPAANDSDVPVGSGLPQ